MSGTLTNYAIIAIVGPVVFAVTGVIYLTMTKSSPYVAGVVSSDNRCSEIGGRMLELGGSAVDAIIATLLCEGIILSHNMGIGGGFLMIFYQRSTKQAFFLNSREVAPAAAYKNMFKKNPQLSTIGGLSVAVPGELKGYWVAHKKFGKLSWSTILQPNIDLCKNGFHVTEHLEKILESQRTNILQTRLLRERYINPKTNSTWKKGDIIKLPALGETLQIVSCHGVDALYKGRLTKNFVRDIHNEGGVITEKDLKGYTPIWRKPASTKLNDLTLYTSGMPGGGPILCLILNILKDALDRRGGTKCINNWQRMMEAFKYSYARRTEIGDPNYVRGMDKLLANLTSEKYAKWIRSRLTDTRTFDDPKHYGVKSACVDDRGTSSMAAIAENGDAVCVTSSINLMYGARVISPSTGIVLNSHMDDFSIPGVFNSYNLPPMPNNYIGPKKIPVSSMSPTVIVDCKGNVRMVIGSAGGSKITSTVASIIIHHLWFNKSIQEAVRAPRLHHQLIPNFLIVEEGVSADLINQMKKIGHKIMVSEPGMLSGATALCVDKKGRVSGSADPRRGGKVYGVPPIR